MATASPDCNPDLVSQLSKEGLDGTYWANVFNTKLGITAPNQLKFLGLKDLEKLNAAARYSWELAALKQVIGINEKSLENAMTEQRDKNQEKQKKAKKLLEELKTLNKSESEKAGEMIKVKEEQLREALDIPSDKWIQQSDTTSMQSVISRYDRYMSDIDAALIRREELTPSQLLANASGGLALRGVLVGKKCEPKKTVLRPPETVSLMNPVMPQVSEIEEISSKEQSDLFLKNLDTMGYSVAASIKGGGWGFSGEGGFSKKHEEESHKESKSHKQSTFHSQVMCTFVPTAACEINKHELRLSEQASQELKQLEKIVRITDDKKETRDRCEGFFNEYGSHVSAGLLHFGGVNKFVATYSSETKSSTEQTKGMVRGALSAYASMSYSGFGVNVGASITGDHLSSKANLSSSYTSSELSKISLRTSNNGGPYEVTAIPAWRMGLMTYNSTWALIDRGGSLTTDFVGIWDLLPNHNEFIDPYALGSTLKHAWQQMHGVLPNDSNEQLDAAVRVMEEIEQEVETWVYHSKLPTQVIDFLQSLLQKVEDVEKATGSTKCWTEMLCKKGACSAFFVKLFNARDELAPKDVPMVQYLIRKLLTSADHKGDFTGRDHVMGWVSVPESSCIETHDRDVDIKTVPELLAVLRGKLLPQLQIQHAKITDSTAQIHDSIDIEATGKAAVMVNNLLESLIPSKQELLFAHACLLEVQYDWTMMRFKAILTRDKIDNFVRNTEREWQQFRAAVSRGKIESEAFLIHLLLQSAYIQEDQITKEDTFNEIIRDVRKIISPEVNKVLNIYATSPFNWGQLTEVTRQMAQSDFSCLEEKAVDLQGLEHALQASPVTGVQELPTGRAGGSQEVLGAYNDILTRLGLTKYYQRRISLQQATTVRPFPEKLEPFDLPWALLQGLIALDYHARDSLLSCLEKIEKKETKDTDSWSLDLGESDDESNGDDRLDVSPMDILLATFSCCDGILQQVIAQNLFMCKLAIPFLYPAGSPDNLVFSLWALRTIIVEWRADNKEAMESPVTDHPFAVVSFVRLGKPPISKSKLLNDILRNDTHHTFFNPECQNSAARRTIADGMVECSWFLSSGMENDVFKTISLMLNLRGEGSTYQRQLSFVAKLSSVVVVITNIEDIAEPPQVDSFAEICKGGRDVILLLTSKSNSPDMKKVKDDWQKCVRHVGKEHLKGVRQIVSFKKGLLMTASELKTELRKHLSKVLEDCPTISLEKAAVIAADTGFLVDEDNPLCTAGKRTAQLVMKHMEGKHIVKCKNELLPLQGQTWFEYSKLLKKQHRASAKKQKSVQNVEQEMLNLRRKQLKICQSLTPFCNAFLTSLLQTDDELRLYFLQWMKLYLDAESRLHLPRLHKEYGALWTECQKAKKERDEARQMALQIDVAQAERNLAEASFGLENLFRELGQIYEAVNESSSAIEKGIMEMVENLPEIAAQLLLRGYPLELVDGDASNVPITWIKAVLAKLEKVIANQRLFVISVLGIQSSGKSTLLNTMFGLKFAVSAGRCTRGAFMQVIKVDQDDLPMGYIAVIDTEGLRAPELAQAKYSHDNELATLTIGLGDVTLMNIKGENTAEVKDILQIAVHAFMRMKIVNKDLNMHQKCVFIHQNVPAVNAKEKMMHGRQKLQESLDSMTQEAAEEESISDIQAFSQIIGFDVHDHVWHFLDLWHGNPPMAPTNPGYSENVIAVRKCLLTKIAKQQTTFLTIPDLSVRTDDLWKGILADDFVFSFRSSLEVKAYNSMEAKYFELEWGLQSRVMEWMQTAEIKMKNCETVEELERATQMKLHELGQVISSEVTTIRKSLDNYFQQSNLQEIIIQWKQAKLNALNFDSEQRHIEGKKHLLAIKEAQRIDLLQRTKWEKHEQHVMNKAVELADKLKGKDASDAELNAKFNKMWIPMVNELASKNYEEKTPMDALLRNILWRRFQAQGHILAEELDRHPLCKPVTYSSLEGSINVENVRTTDISLTSSYLTQVGDKIKSKVGWAKHPVMVAKHKTVSVTCKLLQDIDVHLQDLCRRDIKFQESRAENIIRMFKQGIEDFNKNESKKSEFSILPSYTVKLAVHVSRYCVQVFSMMQLEYEKKHGVVAKLEAYKKSAWDLFQHTVRQSTEELIAADLFCNHLKGIVEKEVTSQISNKVVNEVVKDFSRTKHQLIVKMMDDLANKGCPVDYSSYISNAKTFALKWITRYTNDVIFSIKSGRTLSRYGELTKAHVQVITRCIANSVEQACQALSGCSGNKMDTWIRTFSKAAEKEISVPSSSLRQVAVRNVADFVNLQRHALNQLDTLEDSLVTAFCGQTAEQMKWEGTTPYSQIFDELWGCSAQCPFCCEPCSQTAPDHYTRMNHAHTCVQHRPTGIGGGRWDSNTCIDGVNVYKDELSTQTCNYFIQWKNILFSCRDSNYECRKSSNCSTTGTNWQHHPYVSYKSYLPEWDIAPDSTNSTSIYWMWFMANYQHQLKDKYGAQLPSIPSRWHSYRKEDALADLRRYHH